MKPNILVYDARYDRYYGTQSDGTRIEIDADAYSEALQWRRDCMPPSQAVMETRDPDGWSEDMIGWIPPTEFLHWPRP